MKPTAAALVVKLALVSLTVSFPFYAAAQEVAKVAPPAADPVSSPADNFQILDGSKGNTVRFNPASNWSSYKRIEFAPSTYQPTGAQKPLDPAEAAKLTASFDANLQAAYKDFPLADGPTLRINPIITGIKRTSTTANVITVALIQTPVSYGAASVRYELIDARSGIEIGEITSVRNARPWNVYPWNILQSFKPTGQSAVILRGDAKRLKKDTDELAKR